MAAGTVPHLSSGSTPLVPGYSSCLPRALCTRVCVPLRPFFLEEDADRLLEDMWPFGMAVFSNVIVESLNRFPKQAFNEHGANGRGKGKATGQSAYGRPEAFVDYDAAAPR